MSKDDEWGGITLEEWAERMLRQGQFDVVLQMMKTVPDSKKERYREIWRRVAAEKKEKK